MHSAITKVSFSKNRVAREVLGLIPQLGEKKGKLQGLIIPYGDVVMHNLDKSSS